MLRVGWDGEAAVMGSASLFNREAKGNPSGSVPISPPIPPSRVKGGRQESHPHTHTHRERDGERRGIDRERRGIEREGLRERGEGLRERGRLSGEHDVRPEAWRPIAAKGRETEHVACPVGTRGRHKGAERETARETAREGEDSCPLETQRCVGGRDRNTKWNDESTPRHTRVRTCRMRRIDGVEGTVR